MGFHEIKILGDLVDRDLHQTMCGSMNVALMAMVRLFVLVGSFSHSFLSMKPLYATPGSQRQTSTSRPGNT